MGGTKIPRAILIIFLCLTWGETQGQSEETLAVTDSLTLNPPPNYSKLHGIFAVQSAVYLGSLYGLSKSWYKNPLKNFHFKDDAGVWLQMDKAGHFFTAYQISHLTSEIYRGTGISRQQRILYGALSGFIFQTPIELLDGFSPDYGFSLTDLTANFLGSFFFAGQMLLWDELRLQPKFSAQLTPYAQIRPDLLGRNPVERLLKDYNGQTYWLSFSPGTFFEKVNWPEWLCLSGGYGIGSMTAAETQKSISMGYTPYRKYLLSFDIDLTRLPLRNRFVRNLALMLNSLKIPAPAIEFNSKGEVRFRPLYF